MPETIIDLIRHGEPEGGGRYRGHGVDDPLSEKGWSQMWRAVGDYSEWQQIVTSPMQRCADFASALSKRLGIPYMVEDRLKEIGFGDWEGKTREELKQENLTQYESFYRDPVNCRPPGAEDLDAFIGRVTGAYRSLLSTYIGQNCLIVAHAGVIRSLIANVLHAEPRGLYNIRIENAGISRIRHSHQRGGVLEFINQTDLSKSHTS